jgi:hypothetical protein
MRKETTTHAITYQMALSAGRLGQLIYHNMRKEAMTRAITYWMTLLQRRTQVFLYETRKKPWFGPLLSG